MPATNIDGKKIPYDLVPGSDASTPFFDKPKIGEDIPTYSVNPIVSHESYEEGCVTDPELGVVKLSFLDRILGRTERYQIQDFDLCQTAGEYAHRRACEEEIRLAKKNGNLNEHRTWRLKELADYSKQIRNSVMSRAEKLRILTGLQEDAIFFYNAA